MELMIDEFHHACKKWYEKDWLVDGG